MQPAVGDPASAGGLDWVTHRGPFQPLLFCDSVIFIDQVNEQRLLWLGQKFEPWVPFLLPCPPIHNRKVNAKGLRVVFSPCSLQRRCWAAPWSSPGAAMQEMFRVPLRGETRGVKNTAEKRLPLRLQCRSNCLDSLENNISLQL